MNQAELRQLAQERIKDARALLGRKRWEFAFYAAGYAIECALKSCVLARMIYTGWVFEEKWDAKVCRTHDFPDLIRLAGLTAELQAQLAASAAAAVPGGPPAGAFATNWGIVVLWKVESRYASKTEAEARKLFAAITDKPDGVFRWVKKYW